MRILRTIWIYIEVLKVRETLLLGFLGLCSVIIANSSRPESLPAISLGSTLLLATLVILIASGGANGLTNYLDRHVDARMERTRGRVFPTKRIHPAEKGLVWILFLIALGLGLSWFLHPYVFLAKETMKVAAAVFRKRAICVFPQGVIASYAPVLMGWFSVRSDTTMELILLCVLITVWLPLHVWSVMVSHRNDYLAAGLRFFPMSVSVGLVVRILVVFALLLNITAVWLFFVGDYGILYLVIALVLGIAMLFSSIKLVGSHHSKDAWKLYKLSSFPYLGMIFLAICVSVLL